MQYEGDSSSGEKEKALRDLIDIETAQGLQGGANLSRQISIQLSHEQFEKLYLQPGGVRAKGDATQVFANP
ncbi:hypothetical protein RQP46_009232 [Phenoliferia psychrophenolica]